VKSSGQPTSRLRAGGRKTTARYADELQLTTLTTICLPLSLASSWKRSVDFKPVHEGQKANLKFKFVVFRYYGLGSMTKELKEKQKYLQKKQAKSELTL
jgi:hypothetical protein